MSAFLTHSLSLSQVIPCTIAPTRKKVLPLEQTRIGHVTRVSNVYIIYKYISMYLPMHDTYIFREN